MAIMQLIETIQQLTARHERLLALAEEKREVVIHNRIDDLMRITHEEQSLVKEITGLEQACRDQVIKSAEELGIPAQGMTTISDFIRALPDSHQELRRMVDEARRQLTTAITELQQKNELNRQLIQQSLDYINFNIDFLTDAPEQDLTYQHPIEGQQVKKRTGIFDQKA